MLEFNLKFILRHLFKYKSYATINIVGLTLGMTCALYIFLWLFKELSYDQFHKNKDQLYEVFWYRKGSDGKPFVSVGLPSPVTSAILNEAPEVKAATRIQVTPPRALIKYKNKSIFAEGYSADTSFFNMFSFEMINGKAMLKDHKSIAISEQLAKKVFNKEDPIGKTIMLGYNGNHLFTVTGVYKNVPDNSSLQFDYISSMDEYLSDKPWLTNWGEYSFRAFVLLRPDASVTETNKKIMQILQKNGSVNFDLFLYPCTKLHTGEDLNFKEFHSNGNKGIYRLLFGIAILVLLIACVNFMNLSIALSLRRIREVSIKKIVGSGKLRLISQFFGEAMLMSAAALLITIALVELLLPTFNTLFSSHCTIMYSNPLFLCSILFIGIFTAFFAGGYPAFLLSSFSPLSITKSYNKGKNNGINLRNILVVFQFTASIILIICTLSVNRQIQYIRNKPLGYDKEHIVAFQTYAGIWNRRDFFKKELLKISDVTAATYSEPNVINIGHLTKDFRWNGKSADDDRWFSLIIADMDFLKTFKIQLNRGRDFSELYGDTTNTCIINESAAKAMGLKEVLEESVYFWNNKGKVVGVVNDYHCNNLYQPIHPLVIRIWPEFLSYLYVRIQPKEMASTINRIRQVYEKFETDYPFEYTTINSNIEESYQDNIYFIGKLSTIFSIFTIIIACLGLFGLTSFAAALRTKEIGIRKINGALTSNILVILLKSFTKLVVIAYVIACPIAWYVMHRWFENFAYRTDLSPLIFIVTGFIAFVIALLTILWQSYKAANQNPVEALRYE